MQSVTPVFTPEEVCLEVEIAKSQPPYQPVIGIPCSLNIVDKDTGASHIMPNWAIAIRFRLDDEERAKIAQGHDIVVTQLVFGKKLAPMNFQVLADGERPVFDMSADDVSKMFANEVAPPVPGEVDQEDPHTEKSNVVQMPSAVETERVIRETCIADTPEGQKEVDDLVERVTKAQADGSGD